MQELWRCFGAKPDKGRGPVINTMQDTRKLVHAEGHVVYNWKVQQREKPTARIYIDMEAGLCRRPYCVYKGSPTKREAR